MLKLSGTNWKLECGARIAFWDQSSCWGWESGLEGSREEAVRGWIVGGGVGEYTKATCGELVSTQGKRWENGEGEGAAPFSLVSTVTRRHWAGCRERGGGDRSPLKMKHLGPGR